MGVLVFVTVLLLAILLGSAILRRVQARDAAPGADLRLRNLEVMTQGLGGAKAAEDAVRAGLSDRSPRVRLRAAVAAGDEGLGVLLELTGGDTAAEVRAQALVELAKIGGDRAWPSIERALAIEEEVEVHRAAIVAAGITHHVHLLPRITDLAGSDFAATAQAVARTLGQLGDPRAEPTLIRLLEHDAVAVRREAAEALGLVGTTAAVEKLHACTEGLLTDRGLERAAEDAIARIHARLGPVEAGGLSLAQEERAGALSLTEPGTAGPRR